MASNGQKSYLGINAQFFNSSRNNVNVRNLGILQFDKRHTAENIFARVKNILISFKVNLNQIFCVTSDNGRNVVAAGKTLQKFQRNSHNYASIFRCFEHTLQLAIQDAYEIIYQENDFLNRMRSIVKALKSSEYIEEISKLKIKVPQIDTKTRWNSLYKMLEQLNKQKDKLLVLYSSLTVSKSAKIKIIDVEWGMITKHL